MGILVVNSDFGKIWGITEREYYSRQYLTYELLEDQEVDIAWTLSFPDDEQPQLMTQISYSIDDGDTWTDVVFDDEEGYFIEGLKKGDRLLVKGNGSTYNGKTDECIQIAPQGTFKVYGNIMSLIYGDNFIGKDFDTDRKDSFGRLFDSMTSLMNAEYLILPNNVANSCYIYMFSGCEGLVKAPELLAEYVEEDGCYNYMFEGCSNLDYIKMMAIDCYGYDETFEHWVDNVADSGTFVKRKNEEWSEQEASDGIIPDGWTVIEE